MTVTIKAYRRAAYEYCPGFVLNGTHYYWPNITYQSRFEAMERAENAIDQLIKDAIEQNPWYQWNVLPAPLGDDQ